MFCHPEQSEGSDPQGTEILSEAKDDKTGCSRSNSEEYNYEPGRMPMYETDEVIQHLQALLDRSIEQAGVFLRASFEMTAHSLSARQLVHLWQGLQTVAFATATKKGDPLVAPIGALLLRGRFYIPTVVAAIRTRHVMQRPAISFTFYQGNDVAVIAHGEAAIVRPDDADFAAIETFQRAMSGNSVLEWGEGVFLHIVPRVIYTYVRIPERLPEGETLPSNL
jgi:Pyridoxamine 5'-phosphate oxidase